MSLHTITIQQFLQHSVSSAYYFSHQLILTDHIENLERFKSPCRIDAVTILVCIGGEFDCSINLKNYHIGQDTLLVNLPDDILQIHQAKALDAYAIVISSDLFNKLEIDFKWRSNFYLNTRQNAICHLPHDELLGLKPYFSLLQRNIQQQRGETSTIIHQLLQAFSNTLISIIHHYRQCSDEKQTSISREEKSSVANQRNRQLFEKFMLLLKQHHACARGVKFYADKLCLTPNYLSCAVKEFRGKTVTEWVNEYVILEAKFMLKDADLSISSIAYTLHFSSPSAFGKYFKQQTGLTPKDYRNNRS